jgi:hypothetical protein
MAWKGLFPSHQREKVTDAEARAAFGLSTSQMVEDLFQLLTLFLADHAVVESFGKDMSVVSTRGDPLADLRFAVVEPAAIKLLIETAVKNRWRADAGIAIRRQGGIPQPDIGPWSPYVGRVLENLENEEWQPLSLRESCNKIIHADEIEAEFKYADGCVPFLTGMVTTKGRGRKPDTSWAAEINIVNYVRVSIFNMYGGIDFPRGWVGR